MEEIFSPILAVASYQHEEYFDGSMAPVCLTLADTFWPAMYFVLSISVFFVLPLGILVVIYTLITRNLMENPSIITVNSGGNFCGNSILRYRKQVVVMLGTVVLSFFVCLLPFRALTLWIIIVPPETVMSLGLEGYYILLYFCRVMLYLNSAVNPILYNLMSSKFREGFIRLLKLNRLEYFKKYKVEVNRRNTFNTTTSTNLSSSQNSDSFWRRYSKSASQKQNGNSAGSPKAKNAKGIEIIKLQNLRRQSMQNVTSITALGKESFV